MEFNQTIVAVQLIKAIIVCVRSVLIERMLLFSVVGSFVLTSKRYLAQVHTFQFY